MSEKLKQLKPYLIPHPLYFGCLPLLMFYGLYAMLQTQPDVLALPLILIASASIVLYLLLLPVFRNPDKAAIAATIVLTVFFSMSYLFVADKIFTVFGWEGYLRSALTFLLFLIWAVLLACFFLVIRLKKPLEKPRKWLNEIGMWLVLLEVLVIAGHELQLNFMWAPQMMSIYSEADNQAYKKASDVFRKRGKELPDVYMIVLDENPSHFVLNQFFDYDNKWFVDELEKRGFVVATGAHSNYPRTQHTLSSMLNMTYINDLAKICGKDSTDWSATFDLIRKGRVIELFKAAGHKHIHFGSYAPPTDYNPHADKNLAVTFFNYFVLQFTKSTAIGLMPNAKEYFDQVERDQRLGVLSGLKQVAEDQEAKFVFAHVYLPHEPFLFDAKGQPTEVDEGITGECWTPVTKEGFKNQTIFLEHKILEVIDHILRESKRQPIILIQGDHGPNSSGFITTATPNDNVLVERYGILSAYLVPEQFRSTIYNTITPVNVFRAIVNGVTGTNQFPPLKESMYYSAYPLAYKFVDVTEREQKQEKLLMSRDNQSHGDSSGSAGH